MGNDDTDNANDVFRKSLEKVEVALKSEDVCERSPEDRYFCTSGAGGKGTCVKRPESTSKEENHIITY